jgi:hypothetical protein
MPLPVPDVVEARLPDCIGFCWVIQLVRIVGNENFVSGGTSVVQ